DIGPEVFGKLVAIVHAVSGKSAPKLAIPIDGLDQRAATLAFLVGGDERARHLPKEAVLRLPRILSSLQRALVGSQRHNSIVPAQTRTTCGSPSGPCNRNRSSHRG